MSNFTLEISLTEKGFKEKNRVIEYVYSYINMLKEKGVNEKLFNEIKAKRHLSFEFMEKSNPFYYVSNLAGKM